MPGRLLPLVNDEIYHVYNRGIDHRPTFLNKKAYTRAVDTIKYYRFADLPLKLSLFLKLSKNQRNIIIKKLNDTDHLVDIICFCLMPNHIHFCLRQKLDYGISKFMSNLQNSYTRYFNTRGERTGPLFLDSFKAVRIITDDQLIHLSRYIHLNPYSSFVVKTIHDTLNYPWSSFNDYLNNVRDFCETDTVLSSFKSLGSYKKFVTDRADYQRSLEMIKHLTLED